MNQDRYAIVGYGFRMPGGISTADGFWRLLTERGFLREPVADRYGPGYEPVGGQVSASGNWRPPHGPNEFAVTGTSLDMLPNRISYAFNLTGPSATYMTACSSGATAMHAAVTALARGDCDQAVVGASTYLGSAQISAGFARLGVISPDGGCRSFDATANGYMRSEGVFVYLVKPLAAAEAAGDRVLALIAGTAVNTAGAADGATGTGPGRMITAPTQHGQVALMRAACAQAGLSPDKVDYLEAHATGTRVGDRIEGNAIGQVFGGPDRVEPLRIARQEQRGPHGGGRVRLRAAEGAAHVRAPGLRPGLPALHGPQPGHRLHRAAGPDRARAVRGRPRGGRDQLIRLRRGQRALPADRVPARASAPLPGAGTGRGIPGAAVGPLARGAARDRARARQAHRRSADR